jgi:hypothetical protein
VNHGSRVAHLAMMLFASLAGSAGCNAILGNEEGFLDPPADAAGETPRSDADVPDASLDIVADRSVTLDVPAGDRSASDRADVPSSDGRADQSAGDAAADRAADQLGVDVGDMSVSEPPPDVVPPADRTDDGDRAGEDAQDGADVSDGRDEPPCVPPTGTPCGSCGGTVKCDGTCSAPTPPDYGQSCGQCGGTVKCDGTCSVATPPSHGQTCGLCNGTILCSGACSNLGDPANCMPGHCGLGCSGTCTCTGTNQVCNSNSLTCVGTCSSGQRCCEPIQGGGCGLCVGSSQVCP